MPKSFSFNESKILKLKSKNFNEKKYLMDNENINKDREALNKNGKENYCLTDSAAENNNYDDNNNMEFLNKNKEINNPKERMRIKSNKN